MTRQLTILRRPLRRSIGVQVGGELHWIVVSLDPGAAGRPTLTVRMKGRRKIKGITRELMVVLGSGMGFELGSQAELFTRTK